MDYEKARALLEVGIPCFYVFMLVIGVCFVKHS